MQINYMFIAKAYVIPAVIIVLSFALLVPFLTPYFGPSFGTATSVIVQLFVAMLAIWFARKAVKVKV